MTGFPQRQGSQGFGTIQSQLAVGQESIQFIPPHPSTVRGTSFGLRVLYKHSQQHRLAKEARLWVKVRDRSELRSGSVVDFRVVDLFVIDVRLTWMS